MFNDAHHMYICEIKKEIKGTLAKISIFYGEVHETPGSYKIVLDRR